MIKQKTHDECADDDCSVVFRLFKTTDKYCSYACKKKNTAAPKHKKAYIIPKFSKKERQLVGRYLKVRADFMNSLQSHICPVFNDETVTDVHHKMGKTGFYDAEAEANNIPLKVDVRFFLAVSRKGHDKIEDNPIWAKEHGFSLNRLDKH